MQKSCKLYTCFAMLLTLLALQSLAWSHPQQMPFYSVTITPAEAAIEPGEALQLEAHLFDARGRAIEANGLAWIVKPDSLGKISDDGFFQAGRRPGEVTVLAVFSRGNLRYSGEAKIAIGQPAPPLFKIEVLPKNAVLEPGASQQYQIAAIARDNSNFVVDNVRWTVQPPHVGTIDQNGLFVAGQNEAQGQVVAYVDVNRVVHRAAARVTVSEKPTASLSGTVIDAATGLPITGAHLLIQKIGPIRWMQRARTDSMGNYTAPYLIPGLYIVRANAKNYLPEYYDDKETLAEANVLTIAADDSLTGIDFDLVLGGAIRGFVKTETDSLPIANSLVAAVHVISQRKTYALSGADGTYEIDGLRAGDYNVHASAAGYQGEFFDDAQPNEQPAILSVTPPEVIEKVDFYLATSSGIAGAVIDAATGAPIANAKVTVFERSAARDFVKPAARGKTDENGQFLIGVRPGSYFVFTEARGYIGEFYDDKTNLADADTVEVVENAHTQLADIALDKLGSISGTVIDENTSAPLAGATVIAFLESELRRLAPGIQGFGPFMRSYRTRTDENGNYLLENLPAGKYYVQALAKGYLPEYYDGVQALDEATLVEVERATTTTGIDFQLGTGGSIAGTVSDSTTGLPLAGATVTVWSNTHDRRSVAFTANDGSYRITGLPDGEYFAFARLSGYEGRFYDGAAGQDEATLIKIESGAEQAGIDFQLPKFTSRAGTIAGVVTSEPDSNSTEPGSPLAGAIVFAIPVSPGPAHFDITDALGNYRITRLVPGDYVVLAWARGHLVEFYDDASHWRDAKLVTAVANQVVEGIDFDLQRTQQGPYRIRGVVRRKQGSDHSLASAASLNGLVVYAYNEAGLAASALTDGDGGFSIDEVPAGDYKLKINGAGYEDAYYGGSDEQSAQVVSISSGRSQENIEIEIEETITSVDAGESALPESFFLEQNYPNPFNPQTTIRFALPADSDVKLLVYNLIGQRVRTLVNKTMKAGTHQVQWNGRGDDGVRVASGIYLLRFEAGDAVQTRRMILMK